MTSSPDPLAGALQFLPHGPEFRFLDRLVSLVPGQKGVGEYRVRGDELFLRGHFPGDPLFPGVLLIEAAAQLTGVVAQSDPAVPPQAGLKLAAVRKAKILGTARPGQTLLLQARVTARLGPLIQATVEVTVRGQPVLTAEIALGSEAAISRPGSFPQSPS